MSGHGNLMFGSGGGPSQQQGVPVSMQHNMPGGQGGGGAGGQINMGGSGPQGNNPQGNMGSSGPGGNQMMRGGAGGGNQMGGEMRERPGHGPDGDFIETKRSRRF